MQIQRKIKRKIEIVREREGERERERKENKGREQKGRGRKREMHTYICICIYIYIHMFLKQKPLCEASKESVKGCGWDFGSLRGTQGPSGRQDAMIAIKKGPPGIHPKNGQSPGQDNQYIGPYLIPIGSINK